MSKVRQTSNYPNLANIWILIIACFKKERKICIIISVLQIKNSFVLEFPNHNPIKDFVMISVHTLKQLRDTALLHHQKCKLQSFSLQQFYLFPEREATSKI